MVHKDTPLLKDSNLKFQEEEHAKIIDKQLKVKEMEISKGNKIKKQKIFSL